MSIKRPLTACLVLGACLLSFGASAAEYIVDTRGAHASVNFKIPHLGYSMLLGRFDEFSGSFTWDKNDPSASKIEVVIKTASINSNHTARDNHLRNADFLEVEKYPEATFVSTKVTLDEAGMGTLEGNLTLHGVTKPVIIQVTKIGEGDDPWGGYRVGFSGATVITMADFGIDASGLGPASQQVELELHIEGVRQ